MPTLSTYLTELRRLLKDPNSVTYSTPDLTAYINESRNQCALETECVSFTWQYDVTGQVSATGTITQGSTTVSGITDTTAITIGSRVSGNAALAALSYVVSKTSTTVTMNTAATGSTSAVPLKFTPLLSTATLQEIYPYGTSVAIDDGIQDVIQVKRVRVNWGGVFGSTNYTLDRLSQGKYDAWLGFYGPNLQGNPAVWTMMDNEAVAMRPIPSSPLPMQWGTVCTPVPLVNDSTPDVIPYAWSDSIKYHGAYLALLGAQRKDDAKGMLDIYELYAKRATSFKQRTIVPSLYR